MGHPSSRLYGFIFVEGVPIHVGYYPEYPLLDEMLTTQLLFNTTLHQ